jgi:hypothetical protein
MRRDKSEAEERRGLTAMSKESKKYFFFVNFFDFFGFEVKKILRVHRW